MDKTPQTPLQQTNDTAYFIATSNEKEEVKQKMKEDIAKRHQNKSYLTTVGLIIMALAAVIAPLFYLIGCSPFSCSERPSSEQLGCSICGLATTIIGIAFFVLGAIIAIVGAIVSCIRHHHFATNASRRTTTYNESEKRYRFWTSFNLALGFIFSFFGILILLDSRDSRMIPWIIALFGISTLFFTIGWIRIRKK